MNTEESPETKEIVDIIISNQNAGGDIFNDLDLEERSGQTSFWKKFNKYHGKVLNNIKMLHDGKKRASNRKFRFLKLNNEDNNEKEHSKKVIRDGDKL